jgi:methyl-accepting chemotaxis protein
MESFFWAALGFLVVTTLGGAVFVGIRGWRFWHTFVSLAAGVGGGTDRLLTGAEQLTAHAERIAAGIQELAAAAERLKRTQRRARTLLGAAGEVRDLLRLVSAFVPQK